jgi:3-oxoacyl-[acyl-carrier-protein] synthase III
LSVFDDRQAHDYREFCELLFKATPCEPRALCAAGVASPEQVFAQAPTGSQLDLAVQAVQGLSGGNAVPRQVSDARLIIYATSSIDEDPHRSTVSCLAAQFGASAVPHFGLGQLQAASLDVATELIDGSLSEDGACALFVAAERWPLPYPRLWDGRAMADGAAALWFVRGQQPGLHYLGGIQRGHDPFVSAEGGAGGEPRIAYAAIEDAVAEAVIALLDGQGIGAPDVDGWVCGALDAEMDLRLQQRIGAKPRHRVPAPPDAGHLGTVTAPLLLAELLDQVNTRRIPHGSLILSWNAGLGGTVTASLWRACHEGHPT